MTQPNAFIARLKWKYSQGELVLMPGMKWVPRYPSTGDRAFLDGMLERAKVMTMIYEYEPADGYPGYRLSSLVADELKATLEQAPLPPEEEGVVH